VIQLASSSVSVIVTPGLPVKSMREFIEPRAPGAGEAQLFFSGERRAAAFGHGVRLKLDAHLDLVHVPYKGSGGALADLVGGHVQAMIVSLQTVAPYVQSASFACWR